jgi:hypothetical protein
MSLWGRNDQAVTANSTTTKESSNGAPIGTYALVKGDQVGRTSGANAHFGNTSPMSRANVDVRMFNNVTPGVFIPGQAVGVFGADTTEVAVSNTKGIAHAGWVVRRAGTGSLASFTINASATALGYDNTDIITVKSQQAGGNATVTFTTNATGGSLVFTISNAGAGFDVVTIPTSNISITNATGGTAAGNTTVTNFIATAGGRAGRVHFETLVAMGSLGAQTAPYGTPASVADASDDTILPDS